MILLDYLTQILPRAKRQTLKRMVQAGRVMVNGVAADRLKQVVGTEDSVRILEAPQNRVSGRFPIVYEDADLLVIDKPAGLLTSTVPGEPRPTALAAAVEYLGQTDRAARIGLIHRLDREVSGLLVFSKNPSAYRSLKTQFFHRTASRGYAAIVSPPPAKRSGRIQSMLVEWADGSVHSTRLRGRGQDAITEYEQVRGNRDYALLRVKLETGRKHQIRAQLAEKGMPIIGDPTYGGLAEPGGVMLAAVELELDHPGTGKRMKFKLELPGGCSHSCTSTCNRGDVR